MTKEDAIQAMIDGKKVTHSFFLDDEYVFLNEDAMFQFEDGVEMSAQRFWEDRTSEDWEEDWEIFEEK